MIDLLRIIINAFKLLSNKKSFIIMGVISPAIISLFCTFTFGKESNYKVGVIDKDKGYISKEIVKTIEDIDNVDIIEIKESDYKILLASHQIQLAIIINENFSDNILNLLEDEVIIKSISNSDVKSTIVSIIKSKTEDLNLIAKSSNKNYDKFKEINSSYKDNIININTNKTENNRVSIEKSIGIVIMIIFITGATIANFIIEDEENNTKSRVLVSGVKPSNYYIALIIVFYLLSCVTTIIYYTLCKILNLDFNMVNTNNFLVVMLLINLVSVSLNLCIVSFTQSRYIASTMNILIVIPSCMLSGIFWDFDIMPDNFKKIGAFLPQRWVYICLERLHKYNNLIYIKEYIFAMILISIVLLSISILMFNHRNTN